MSKTETATERAVIAKLRAAKEAKSGHDTFHLKTSGIEVSIPKFRAMAEWSKAAQAAGKNVAEMNTIYITLVARFDGEALTIGEYKEFIPADDHIQISARIFGGGEADSEGN